MTGESARKARVLVPRLRLLLVVATLCCASLAQASCGDYVHHEPSGLDHQPGTAKHPIRPPTQVPCHGPGCQKGDERAPLTVPPLRVVQAKEKALTAGPSLFDASCNYLGTAPRGHAHPIHRCFPPERPPRA